MGNDSLPATPAAEPIAALARPECILVGSVMPFSTRSGGSVPVPGERFIPLGSDLDVVAARVEGRTMAKELGFDIIDQARIATAIVS
jgi:hypothetical protein